MIEMASDSTARSRGVLMGLAVAGALAGSAGGAAAQYYEDYDYDYVPRYGYGYSYGYGQRYAPPAPLSQREIARIALREFGLAQVDRTQRTGAAFVVDGQMANGRRTRLIFDRYSGELVRRVNLQPPGPGTSVVPPVARLDPGEPRPAQPRALPSPPERPAGLKPPAQANAPARVIPPSPVAPQPAPEQEKPPAPPTEASAPATVVPSSPAAPPRAPEPETPAERPPVEASAPATTAPASPVAPAVPTPGPVNPATGEEKPKLVNPNDVRGSGEPERTPPLAKAEPPVGEPASAGMPPVQVEDPAPSVPRPATPIVPVAPLD
jgi:hypothetical protein